MGVEHTRELRRRFLNLGIGEIVAAVIFCFAMAWAISPIIASDSDRLAVWAALIPLVAILVQAGIYWLAARAWIGRGSMPQTMRTVYRCFRLVDAVLLAASLVAVVAMRPSAAALVLALAVWLFGVAEYVNYYVVRLAYPFSRWLVEVGHRRTPRLVKDMRDRSSA
ncbi:hypothetical protein [Microbacterium suwonense]|nr:hypothetical protein [Microbacterium suwonense]